MKKNKKITRINDKKFKIFIFGIREAYKEELKIRKRAFYDGFRDGYAFKGPDVVKKKIDKWVSREALYRYRDLYINYLRGYMKGMDEHIGRFTWTGDDHSDIEGD